MLVALAILSILAAAALPYVEITVRRDREIELRRALRELRTAIDAFHDDWVAGRIARTSEAASEDGWPKTLALLAEGVPTGEASGQRRPYLRRIPRDPFADQAQPTTEHWALRGYRDARDTQLWGGVDVYDVRSRAEAVAIDGSRYREW
jgi:general secretion pathway protein G